MAERRMFAKTIVTSDAFLDMPATTRCLYFLLAMLADDDGFVNNPRSIMRQASATTDDINLLIAKRFILTFESGVVVIKHWKIHNLIQKDRYKETKYLEEKSTLKLDEKNAYTENFEVLDTKCIQDVSKVEAQGRLVKDSLGKERVVEGSEDGISIPLPQIDCLRGSLGKGVVYLTPEQDADLLDKLGIHGYNKYIEKLAHFIIERDAKVGNHYQTILKWYEEDTRI